MTTIENLYFGNINPSEVSNGQQMRLVTDTPYFYISLTMMIIGTQLFLAGFLGDLISRNSSDRNDYQISEEIRCGGNRK